LAIINQVWARDFGLKNMAHKVYVKDSGFTDKITLNGEPRTLNLSTLNL
jgi:hypothetical protein